MTTPPPPPTEKTRFDDYLKEHLWRDLLFRGSILAVLSAAAFLYASRDSTFTAVSHFKSLGEKLIPLLNSFGTGTFFIAIIALMLKDLEDIAPEAWGQGTARGRVGGFVRRLSSDMTLWAMGGFFSVFSAMLAAVVVELFHGRITLAQTAPLGFFTFFMLAGILICACLNVLVRRFEAPRTLFKTTPFLYLTTVLWAWIVYGAFIILLLVAVLFGD